MSEPKKTVEDLQREYSQLCSKAGHLQYQVHALSAELASVNEALKAINLEAAAIVPEAPKSEAPSETI